MLFYIPEALYEGHRLDCGDNGPSDLAHKEVSVPLLLPESCLTRQSLLMSSGVGFTGKRVGGFFCLCPFSFAQADHFGEDLTFG